MTMATNAPHPVESSLLAKASEGDRNAFAELVTPLRKPLFSFVYRMVTHRETAEDLLQDTLMRAMESVKAYRAESTFKTWLFGIAHHVCLDHLRQKKRWRVEAQLIGEQETDGDPQQLDSLVALVSQPDFVFETREHIAFCFACIARTLPPEEQSALMLREVFGFTNEEAATITGVSEPVLRHRLSSARATMAQHYEGLCQLINKTGRCYQCSGLREMSPRKGEELVQITVAPGIPVSPESLLDARLAIVRNADLENGRSRPMHDLFYAGLCDREHNRKEDT
jgi:RNA polymerase sigma-70 factor, ECF subfamily